MVLEVATLNIKPGKETEFEQAFSEAQLIISSMKGYRRHQLQKCVEVAAQYILLVEWESIEDHMIDFRNAAEYPRWKELLHHFYDPFPKVEHYTMVTQISKDNRGE